MEWWWKVCGDREREPVVGGLTRLGVAVRSGPASIRAGAFAVVVVPHHGAAHYNTEEQAKGEGDEASVSVSHSPM